MVVVVAGQEVELAVRVLPRERVQPVGGRADRLLHGALGRPGEVEDIAGQHEGLGPGRRLTEQPHVAIRLGPAREQVQVGNKKVTFAFAQKMDLPRKAGRLPSRQPRTGAGGRVGKRGPAPQGIFYYQCTQRMGASGNSPTRIPSSFYDRRQKKVAAKSPNFPAFSVFSAVDDGDYYPSFALAGRTSRRVQSS